MNPLALSGMACQILDPEYDSDLLKSSVLRFRMYSGLSVVGLNDL